MEKDFCLTIALLFFVIFYCYKYHKTLNNLKDERNYFIKTLSHDFKVAIIAQIRGLNLIKNFYNNDKEKEELINSMAESTEDTLDILNLLINTYQFKNKESVLNYECFDLAHEIYIICNNLYYHAKEKDLSIDFRMENCTLSADKSYILKVVFILLSTAIFYSNKNNKILCAVTKTENNIEFKITYQGVFLTDEEQKRMFSKNSRFSTVGHGIKMHFCKKIIDFHKGKLQISSDKNGNNSFGFIIPSKHAMYKDFSHLQIFKSIIYDQ